MAIGQIKLNTLGRGVALERFDEELARVVENVIDPNTEAKAKRKITLEVTIVPAHDRKQAAISISCQAKLAPVVSYATRAYLGKNGQQFLAFEDNPNQVTVDEFIEAAKENVTPITAAPDAEEESAS